MRGTPLPAQKRRALPASFNGSFSLSVHVPCNQSTPKLRASGADRRYVGVWNAEAGFEFLADQSGATAIEYCLIAVGISIVILAAVNGIGTTVNGKFTSINSSLK